MANLIPYSFSLFSIKKYSGTFIGSKLFLDKKSEDCIIFNLDINDKDKLMYKIKDNEKKGIARKLVGEYDYNLKSGKIPLGVLYKEKAITMEEKWPQLKELMKKKKNWQRKL